MRYFVDYPSHWDIEGYWAQFETLRARLPKRAYQVLSQVGFHDARVLTLQVVDPATTRRRRVKDPTQVVTRLLSCDDYIYTLTYSGVTAIHFSFERRNETYTGRDGQEHFYAEYDGLHDWLYDEVTATSDLYLSHEVTFASGALLHLTFRRLAIVRSRGKLRR